MRGHVKIIKYKNVHDRVELFNIHLMSRKKPLGIMVYEDSNLIVNTGLKTMSHLLGQDPASGAIRYMSFGSGGASGSTFYPPEVADFKLSTEEFREPVAYTFNDGAPEYSITFTSAALADEHPSVSSISEVGLMTKEVIGSPNSGTMDLFARITFPEVLFSSSAPVNVGLVVEWKILFDSVY